MLALSILGLMAQDQGDMQQADRYHEEGLQLMRSTGNQFGLAFALVIVGLLMFGTVELIGMQFLGRYRNAVQAQGPLAVAELRLRCVANCVETGAIAAYRDACSGGSHHDSHCTHASHLPSALSQRPTSTTSHRVADASTRAPAGGACV